MNMDTAIRQDYEQTLLKIARVLPRNRVEQLVDFARFLESQILSEQLLLTLVGMADDHRAAIPNQLWHEEHQKERISVPLCLRGSSFTPIVNRYLLSTP